MMAPLLTTTTALFLVLATIVPSTSASNCHGVSNFRLAPVKNLSSKAQKRAQSLDLKEKNTLCRYEFGNDAKLMDLEQMEGEFKNPADLQHALNPLFANGNETAAYFVADHGLEIDAASGGVLVLKREPNNYTTTVLGGTRVAGQVFLEHATEEDDPELLCYVPKPKYTSGTMSMPMMDSMSGMDMSMPMTMNSSSPPQSSTLVPLLSVVSVLAVSFAVLQTYKAQQAQSRTISSGQAMIDLGGSYSILETNDLAQRLAPIDTELV